jgi:5-methylcytosine-specific restriction endonuclease McrA
MDRIVDRQFYASYIVSEAWFERRRRWTEEFAERFPNEPLVCFICGSAWTLESDDMHHVTYDHVGHEEFDELWPLCRKDHDELHRIYENVPAWRRLSRRQASTFIAMQLGMSSERGLQK